MGRWETIYPHHATLGQIMLSQGLFAESKIRFKADLGIESIEILKAFAQKLFNASRSIRLQQRCISTYRSTSTVLKCTWVPKTGEDQGTLHISTYVLYTHTHHGVSTCPAGVLKLNLLIPMRDSIHWVLTIKQTDWKLRQTWLSLPVWSSTDPFFIK